jgi:cytoskeletal protein CcmA (bactofilin family)
MLQVKPKVQDELETRSTSNNVRQLTQVEPSPISALSAKTATVRLAPPRKASLPQFPPINDPSFDTQTRVPVVIGEISFRGMIPVDGIISGTPGANGGTLSVRQRGRPYFGSDPELNGDIRFRDMLRVNGHIAGSVCSKKGTLIVDTAARVDADIEVSIAVISGTVNGDIVAHQRVEVSAAAHIHGNIWTRSLAIQNGAIFDGVCQMIEGKEESS